MVKSKNGVLSASVSKEDTRLTKSKFTKDLRFLESQSTGIDYTSIAHPR
jgi:hypothetical protein